MRATEKHITEAWRARDIMMQLGRRDVRLRYRQTRLGPLWLLVGPVVNALLFTLVFNRIGKISSGSDTPYFVFALCGLMSWTMFNQATSRVALSFLSSSALVTRVRFPRLVLPGAAVVAASADAALGFVIALTAAVVAAPDTRQIVGALGALGALLAIAWLASALGLLVASLAVRRRDLVQVLPIALQLGLFATPVAYPPSAVPDNFRWLVDLNPVATGIATFRASLLGTPWPSALQVALAVALALVLMLAALRTFARIEPCMADIL